MISLGLLLPVLQGTTPIANVAEKRKRCVNDPALERWSPASKLRVADAPDVGGNETMKSGETRRMTTLPLAQGVKIGGLPKPQPRWR